jgi:putative membrane protein
VETLTIAATELASHGWDHGAWWPIFPIFWILFWGVIIFGFFRFRRKAWHHYGRSGENVLAERYARGEITVDEYRERLSVLRETK